jgi:hypothetical protein
MSFAPLLSCSDGSSVRVNPDFVVAVEPETLQEASVSIRRRRCRVSLVDGEQIEVPAAADEVQRILGLTCIRLALYPSGTQIFLNPSLVLGVEDLSGGDPVVTKSLVLIVMGGLNNSAGHDLAPAFMVLESAQEIMEAILKADRAHPEGPRRVLDGRRPYYAAPYRRSIGPGAESPRIETEASRPAISSPMIKAKRKHVSV